MGSILPKSRVEYLRKLAKYGEKDQWFLPVTKTDATKEDLSWSGGAKSELEIHGYALEYQEGEEYAPE